MRRKVRDISNLKTVTGGAALLLAGIAVVGAFLQQPATPSPAGHTTTLNVQSSGQVKGDATTAPNKPALAMQTVTETQPIPFTTTNQDDPNLPPGQSEILIQGVNGVETLTYAVTATNGQQTSKALLSKVVTTPPINQVVGVGTATAPQQPAPPTCTAPSDTTATLDVQIKNVQALNNAAGDVQVQTQPCASLTIKITYCNGDHPTSQSLYHTVEADQNGLFMWAWLPQTISLCTDVNPSNLVVVTATWEGQSAIAKQRFSITPQP